MKLERLKVMMLTMVTMRVTTRIETVLLCFVSVCN